MRNAFPLASYVLLEDPDLIARIRSDPHGFLHEIRLPVILDEIQNVPELFNYIRSRIDADPDSKGRWFFTGSQESPLMKGVSESMAGRIAVLQLLPFSIEERPDMTMLTGGFPEIANQPASARLWFQSYIQTYLERDIRQVSMVSDLPTFRRFLMLCASRSGQMLNKTDMAAPLGVSVPTVSAWINILEITCQINLIYPFYENFGKRLVKSPKLYFSDSGLLCHLLGIDSEEQLKRSPFLGHVYEGLVASEIIKKMVNTGRARQLYYFRDRQGLEVDFIVPVSAMELAVIEAKASMTVTPDMAGPMARFIGSASRYQSRGYIVHQTVKHVQTEPVSPGIRAVSITGLLESLYLE